MNYRSSEENIRIDWLTVVIYILLVAFGAVNIYSANSTIDHSSIFDFKTEYGKQFIWIGITAIIVFLIMIMDPNFFTFSGYGIYIVVIAMLLILLATGSFNKGAQAWFKIGSFKLQPSEFAKYATSLALAKFLGTFDVKFEGRRNIMICFGIIFLPMLLTLAQNDTGSALVFASFFLVLYREGFSGWWLVIGLYLAALFVFTILFPSMYLIAGILVLCCVAIYFLRRFKQMILLGIIVFVVSSVFILSVDFIFAKVLQPHQQQRILVTLNQDVAEYYPRKAKEFSLFKIDMNRKDEKASKRDYSYNVRQSKISIGAGRWTGNGFNNGTQTKAKLVPEQHTDFIFCTVGEEYGFIGSTLFVLTYLLFIGRLYYMAERQKNVFSRVYGYCVASVIFFHFFVNVGMALGVLPVIGIPLPFMSYGGSSLFSFSMMLFTFLKLDANRVNEISRMR